jgi:hypothetical protein
MHMLCKGLRAHPHSNAACGFVGQLPLATLHKPAAGATSNETTSTVILESMEGVGQVTVLLQLFLRRLIALAQALAWSSLLDVMKVSGLLPP